MTTMPALNSSKGESGRRPSILLLPLPLQAFIVDLLPQSAGVSDVDSMTQEVTGQYWSIATSPRRSLSTLPLVS